MEIDIGAENLAAQPGFLIRRLHQAYKTLFAEECAAFGITPVQHSILVIIATRPGLEQNHIAELAGLERIALAKLVTKLAADGLVKRVTSRLDRRNQLLALTPRGHEKRAAMQASVDRAQERLMAALAPDQLAVFLRLLAALAPAELR